MLRETRVINRYSGGYFRRPGFLGPNMLVRDRHVPSTPHLIHCNTAVHYGPQSNLVHILLHFIHEPLWLVVHSCQWSTMVHSSPPQSSLVNGASGSQSILVHSPLQCTVHSRAHSSPQSTSVHSPLQCTVHSSAQSTPVHSPVHSPLLSTPVHSPLQCTV